MFSQNESKLTRLGKGKYTVKVTDRTGNLCVLTDTADVQEPTIASGEGIAYPNPTTGITNLELCGIAANKATIQIRNGLNQLIEQKEIINAVGTNIISVNLSSYSKGVYFITVIVNGTVQEIYKAVKL